MKEIVKVYTDCLNAYGYGDFVRCLDCGELALIQVGGTACGNCESDNLSWAINGEIYEISVGDLKKMGYIIEEV